MTDPNAPTTAAPMLRIPKSAHPVPTDPVHRSLRIPPLAYAAGALVLVGGLVVGAQALGWYGTSGRTNASTGERVELTSSSTSADIKGWMTIQQFLDAFPVSRDQLYAQFDLPASTPTSETLGSLKEAGIGTLDVPSLRAWVDSLGR